jgi:hypothetical protein
MADSDSPQRGPRLLDELQAIRDLLNDRDNAGVPLLRDVVKPGAVPLLDLNEIFEELTAGHGPENSEEQAEIQAQAAHFVAAQQAAFASDAALSAELPGLERQQAEQQQTIQQQTIQQQTEWHRELLIQEVVDDFIPHIEAALRERLRQIDSDTLRRWLSD